MSFETDLEAALDRVDVLADPATPALRAIMPFVQPQGGYTRRELAEFALRTLVVTDGNPNRTWDRHLARSLRLGVPTSLPSPETTRRAVGAVQPPPRPNSSYRHDYDDQARRHGKVYAAQARHFCKANHVEDRAFYLTIDGSPLPKYGAKAYESDRPIEEFTEVARWAQPIKRSHTNKQTHKETHYDFFKGTTGGLESMHAQMHVTATCETQTLFIDPTLRRNFPRAVRNCVDAFERLPRLPKFLVVDKQFTHSAASWEHFRDYADPRGVLVVGPKDRDRLTVSDAQRLWDDELYEKAHLPNGDPIWFSFVVREWTKRSSGHRPFGVLNCYEVVDDDFQPDNYHGTIVNEGKPGREPRVMAFPLQVNMLLTTLQQFLFAHSCIPRRWGCECLFQRHHMFLGGHKGRELFPRQLYEGLAYGVINSFSDWRATKRRYLIDPPANAIDFSWWSEDVLTCLDRRDRAGILPGLVPTRAGRSTKARQADPGVPGDLDVPHF